MKNTVIMLFLALATATGMQACKKDDSPSGPPPYPVNLDNFDLILDGVTYSPTELEVQEVGGVVACKVTINPAVSFTIVTNEDLMPGVYQINGSTPFDLIHTDDGGATYYGSTSGTVSVFAHDTIKKMISGSYNCVLTRFDPTSTKNVTNGAFQFSYK